MPWVIAILWMVLIFQGSADRQSWERSSRFIEPLVRWLLPTASDRTVGTAVLLGRKCAHVAEFAILTVLVWWALRPHTPSPRAQWPRRTALLTLLIVTVYAVSDEVHQSFVPTRQGSVVDILVDTTGSVFALALLVILSRWRDRREQALRPADPPT